MRTKGDLNLFAPKNQQVIDRNKIVDQYCTDNNIALVDFYSETADSIAYYSNDGVHFNTTGVKKEAELIIEKILEILQ